MRTARALLVLLLLSMLAGLFALPGAAAPLGVPTNPGTTNLISWWTLDQASGTRNDSHGANNLSDNNTVSYAPGVKYSAASFVAANSEYLSIGSNASLQPGAGSFTICVWVNFADEGTNASLASKYMANQVEYDIRRNSQNTLSFILSPNGTSLSYIESSSTVVMGSWYFVCAWLDKGSGTANIQINNGTVDSTAYTSNVFAGTAPFLLGAVAIPTYFLNGKLDEVMFYKRALTADERSWLYNAGAGRNYAELIAPPPDTSTFTNTPVTPSPTNTPVTPTNTPITPGVPGTPGTPYIPTAEFQAPVTLGEYSSTVAISLLCLILILAALGWIMWQIAAGPSRRGGQ